MKLGLDEVGGSYEDGEYFLSDLIHSGIMATKLTEIVKPLLSASAETSGKVLIGTVRGDIHDIGKNLVISMLTSQGFEVIDAGVDVTLEKFLESAEASKPDVLATSCLLTVGIPETEKVVKAIKKRGLEVKTLVGGRAVTPEFAREIGADGYAKDAIEAVKVARRLVGVD